MRSFRKNAHGAALLTLLLLLGRVRVGCER